MPFLDLNGLNYFTQQIKQRFATKQDASNAEQNALQRANDFTILKTSSALEQAKQYSDNQDIFFNTETTSTPSVPINADTLQGNNIKQIILLMYPVGSVYQTFDASFDPNIQWGGKWEKIENLFLFGRGKKVPPMTQGGERTHTLTITEIPEHRHSVSISPPLTPGGNVIAGAATYDKQYNTGTDLAGGGQPHNNMPPYIVIDIWKRIE